MLRLAVLSGSFKNELKFSSESLFRTKVGVAPAPISAATIEPAEGSSNLAEAHSTSGRLLIGSGERGSAATAALKYTEATLKEERLVRGYGHRRLRRPYLISIAFARLQTLMLMAALARARKFCR
jgi:hypothetical protein